MKLNEFIKHIRHNTVRISLYNNDDLSNIYNGCVSSYNHWIHKNITGECDIEYINFDFNDNMCIYLNGMFYESDKNG